MSDFSSLKYDVIVCGAGPAGLKASYELLLKSKGELSVLLLDRKEPWKEPVLCAEAVSTDAFRKYWTIKDSFVRSALSGIYFVSPSGYKAEFYSKDCGLQLNRAELHRDIWASAKDLGLEYDFEVFCKKVNKTDAGWVLEAEKKGGRLSLEAKVLIDATGPGNKLTNHLKDFEKIENGKSDLEPAIFVVAENVPHETDHIELYFGNFFKGGYGWVFPRSGGEVNLGLVVSSFYERKESTRQLLDMFIQERFPGIKIKGYYGGSIACSGSEPKQIAKDGLFKAGDAASTVNPISRSGIVEALKSGTIAANAALEWLQAKTDKEKSEIENRAFECWMKIQGKTHSRIAKAKKAFAYLPDKKLDKAAKRLSKLSREKSTLFRIFFEVLAGAPSLIWKMRSFLKG